MPELNPLTNEQIFLKKIAENTGSNYNTGDVSEINPLTIDQILLKEIAENTAGQSGDITELEEKVSATQDMISDAYDSTQTYNVSDYCIYEDVLYKCNTASTTGTWDSSKWDAVTVSDELGALTSKVNRGYVSVEADGVKTYRQLLQDLYAITDVSKVSMDAKLVFYTGMLEIFSLTEFSVNSSFFKFIRPASVNAYGEIVSTMQIGVNNDALRVIAYGGAEHDESDIVATTGYSFTLYY